MYVCHEVRGNKQPALSPTMYVTSSVFFFNTFHHTFYLVFVIFIDKMNTAPQIPTSSATNILCIVTVK